ncbi:MAG: hypothetical protein M3R29_04085 [Verrucomicrobiota bacterium]|nr:hypothetical protein [Verrucomicrobiota bacterium]
MRRILILLIIGVLGAFAVLYAVRVSKKTSNSAVAALLPRETIALAHLPNFSRTRAEWHQSDIYHLYREPALQDFLGKPLAKFPKKNSLAETSRDLEKLDPKDSFIALTSMANDRPKVVAGFRFGANRDGAQVIISKWRAQLFGNANIVNETFDYERHKIDISTGPLFTLATAYDGRWFFAANDLDELKALLDRADGRAKDQQSLLSANDSFRAAIAEMPANYALCFYLQPKIFAKKLAALRAAVGGLNAPDQQSVVDRIRSICTATRFDNGKMHDVTFVGMPKLEQDSQLTRNSLALGTKDTFLYVASLLNFSHQLGLLDPAVAGNFLGAGLQKIGTTFARAGITRDDWKAAFGTELGALANWSLNSHWPSAFVTVPVKDGIRARKIAGLLARASDEDATWKETDRGGVHYWSMQPSANGFIAFRPTIAVSDLVMIVGLDEASVETAMQRSGTSASELSSSATYKNAARSVPAPTNVFAYIDTALLYSRLDATLRPILLMGAAFMPAVSDYVDLSKLPPPEVIAKHFSPIVSSQRYQGDGYVTESVGPVTLSQSGIALLAAIAFGARQKDIAHGLNPLAPSFPLVPRHRSPTPPSASPTPSGTP